MVNALPCWTPHRPSLLLRLRVEAQETTNPNERG
jgi:hypothetical protein